jgi:hypothetical protein
VDIKESGFATENLRSANRAIGTQTSGTKPYWRHGVLVVAGCRMISNWNLNREKPNH